MDSPASRGGGGEYRVNLMVRLCLSNDYKIWPTAFMEAKVGGVDTGGHIVVSRYGIFVIETKTLKGVIKVILSSPLNGSK